MRRAFARGLKSLPELDSRRLWEVQATAISNLEKSLRDDRPRALVQMATGSGKTFTAANISYRLIRHAGAKRILFLVDRSSLGEQAVYIIKTAITEGGSRIETGEFAGYRDRMTRKLRWEAVDEPIEYTATQLDRAVVAVDDSRCRCQGRRVRGSASQERRGREVWRRPEPVVHAPSLKAAITQLRDLSKANAGRSSQEALVANLVLLRAYGVDDEILDLVVEMVLAQNVDEETTAALNYLASGFLPALLTFEEERALGAVRPPTRARSPR